MGKWGKMVYELEEAVTRRKKEANNVPFLE